MSHVCGRRSGEGLALTATPIADEWRENGTCSYCGSIKPELFFEAVEAGYKITPTDKNYKAYAEFPNPEAGNRVQVGRETGPAMDRKGKPAKPDLTPAEIADGRYDRPVMGIAGHNLSKKFYFQHLDEEQMAWFVTLHNARKMNLAYPGYFYVRPFFCPRPLDALPSQPKSEQI